MFLSLPLVRAAGIFCRKYAGGTLWGTLSRAFPPPVCFMTKYEFLCTLQQQGLLQTLTKEYSLPSYFQWMEYYEFYLAHPNFSYTEISFYFQASRATIYRAIQFMRSPHQDVVSKI